MRSGSEEELALEMADVLAWLATLANIRGIDLSRRFCENTAMPVPAVIPPRASATRLKNRNRNLIHWDRAQIASTVILLSEFILRPASS